MSQENNKRRKLCDEENTKNVLPWDVIAEEILPKVHPKTLAVCKCVSKQWNSHISSPDFDRQLNPIFRCYPHGGGKEPGYLYFCLGSGGRFSRLEIPETEKERSSSFNWHWPVGSSNGLVCFALMDSNRPLFPNFVVWNPPVEGCNVLRLKKLKRLAVYGYYSHFCGGFGFDARSGHHKVIQMAYWNHRVYSQPFSLSASIYTIETGGCWRPCADKTGRRLPADIVEIVWRSPQNSIDGRLIHWLAKREEGRTRLVVSFDFSDEVFRHVALPESLARVSTRDDERVQLASFAAGNSLTLLKYEECRSGRRDCAVWVMKEYGAADSWTELVIGLDEPGRPLGFVNKYDFLVNTKDGKIASYDSRTGEKQLLQADGAKVFICMGNIF